MPTLFWLLSFVITLLVTIHYYQQPSAFEERFFLHFSETRLIVVCILLLFTIVFLLIFWRSWNKKSSLNSRLEEILKNQVLRTIFVIILDTLMVLLLFLLTRKPTFFGEKKAIFQKLETFEIWGIALLFLAGIFGEVTQQEWLCFLERIKKKSQWLALIEIVGIFCFTVVIKIFFVINDVHGPIVIGDEITYYRMADALFNQKFTAEFNHYPFLYPQVLSIAFLAGNNVYTWIKLVNVLLSSSIIFPVYLISRQYLNHWQSIVITFFSVLTPFHIVFPRQMMSENLFFPLFLWAIYFVIHKPENSYRKLTKDLFTGVLLGALYLTRYISLAIIPFLLTAWWYQPFDEKDNLFRPSRTKILHFCGMLVTMVLTFSLWLVYGIRDQIPLNLMLGFGQYGKPTPGQVTIVNLIKWIYLYGCYIALIAAPVLNLLVVGIRQFDLKKSRTGYQNLILVFLAAMGGVFIAVVRHSWKAAYNNLIPAKIMGRYLVYFSALFFILAVINLENFDRNKYKNIWHFLIETTILPAALVFMAYLTLIQQTIIPIGKGIIKLQGSVDAFFVKSISSCFLPVICILYAVTNLLLWYNKKNEAIVFLTLGLSGYLLLGSPTYFKELQEEQIYPQLGEEIINIVTQDSAQTNKLPEFVIIMPPDTNRSFFSRVEDSLEVHGKGNPLVFREKPGIVLPSERVGFSYVVYNKEYSPIELDNRYIIYIDELVDTHPNSKMDYHLKIQTKEFIISIQP